MVFDSFVLSLLTGFYSSYFISIDFMSFIFVISQKDTTLEEYDLSIEDRDTTTPNLHYFAPKFRVETINFENGPGSRGSYNLELKK